MSYLLSLEGPSQGIEREVAAGESQEESPLPMTMHTLSCSSVVKETGSELEHQGTLGQPGTGWLAHKVFCPQKWSLDGKLSHKFLSPDCPWALAICCHFSVLFRP